MFGRSIKTREYAKLRNNPVIPNMVSEIIRWQTPLSHMRRIANRDYELNGQTIKAGDKVIMYLSGNRDERSIDRPNEFIIDRIARANTCPLALECIVAWATVWLKCSFGSFGKR